MAGPYYTNDAYGITKLTDQAPNFSKGDGVSPSAVTSTNEARGASGLGSIKGGVGASSNKKTPPKYLPPPKAVAKPGGSGYELDPNALGDAAAIGLPAAGVIGAYALNRMRGAGGTPTPDMAPQVPGTSLVPSSPPVTQLRDEQVIPRVSGAIGQDANQALKAAKAQALIRAMRSIVP